VFASPIVSIAGSRPLQQKAVAGSDGSNPENGPEKPKKRKGKKKLLDREDYAASAHSSYVESVSDASSVVHDDFLEIVKRKKKPGFTSDIIHDRVNKLDENYCGLCGSIHAEACHMVQNPGNLAEYRAMLMAITNEEPVETRVRRSVSGP
jgi:hypothetical protein